MDDNSLVKSLESDLTVQQIFNIMGQDLLRWKRILRSTGGDLALQKCTVSLMKWRWGEATGEPILMKKIDGDNTIVIEDYTEGVKQQVCLKRLEIDESQKQLGIILPIDGSFKQEYERRKQMSRDLGMRMYIAPLNAYESVLVYRLYYCPKVGYPLSLTNFSKKDSENIQSQFYRYALPKMGVNRHTPHAIVFGPLAMGGLELHHIFIEQIVQHIRTITLHIRRQDFVGTTFLSNVKAYTVLIGSAKPLLSISPVHYNYGEKNSTVYWMWRQNQWWKLGMYLAEDKGFQSKFTTETNSIMDDAVADNIINGDSMKLFAINACRLFHGVTFPSDMSHYEGKYLKQQYLYGNKSQRKQKHENWPTQPCPLDKHWVVWRDFVC